MQVAALVVLSPPAAPGDLGLHRMKINRSLIYVLRSGRPAAGTKPGATLRPPPGSWYLDARR